MAERTGAHVLRLHRTLSVLRAIAELGERGFGPSNREVAERTGIKDAKAQPREISRLLWCLEALELIENTAKGQVKGGPNAWRLTAKGEQLRRVTAVREGGQAGGI
jgi:hypothetical protein